MQYAITCFDGAHNYFKTKFDENTGELASVVQASKASRMFFPQRVNELCPTADQLLLNAEMLSFLPAELIAVMQVELPKYLASQPQCQNANG